MLAAAPVEPIEAHIQAEQWRKADRAWRAAAETLAAQPVADNEADIVSEFLVLRAVIAAGRGKARHADWSWWMADVFGDPRLDAVIERYGKAGQALAGMVQPPPELAVQTEPRSGPPRLVSERTDTVRRPRITELYRVACEGETGVLSLRTRRDAEGYHRAPRATRTLDDRPAVRPWCAVAVADEFRDQKVPGGKEGTAITIHRPLGVTIQ